MFKMQERSIKEIFDEIITNTQSINNPNTDDVFDKWSQNKKRFVDIFNGELIYEIQEEVTFESSEKVRKLRFNNFIYSCEQYYGLDQRTIDFLKRQKNGFFDNKVVEKEENIQVGSKLSKSLKLFIKNKNTLIEVQNLISRIIQEETVSGKLCFSVHPLDYLSISENNHNWTSCHSLDGERRSGNLNYMADKCTIVCYLKSKEPTSIGNFPRSVKWNSKKWRILLYVGEDNNIIFAGRQYPFESDAAMEYVRNCILKLFPDFSNWKEVRDDNLISLNGKEYSLLELITNNDETVQFNDVILSTLYDPLFIYRGENIQKVKVGEPVKCISCGIDHISFGERMKCESCNDGFYCHCCGDYTSEEPFVIDEEHLCECCYERETECCAICGTLHLSDSLTYDAKAHGYICIDCLPDDEEFDDIEERNREYRNMQGF